METVTAPKPTRRGFLGLLVMLGSLVASYGTAAVYVLRFVYPRQRDILRQRVYVTDVATLRREGQKTFRDVQGREAVLIEASDGFRAISTTCTHLGCRALWQAEHNTFHCPCHDATFAADGQVLSGPPPRPLNRYEVAQQGESIFVIMEV
ncbi:cytochrome B6 [Candidatus Poribacteria bacterium]|nr:cytochrome B6 [Candidatus Poribacteria bacterium]